MRIGNSTLFHVLAMAALLMVMALGSARAHVMLAEPNAAPGSHYIAHFKVGHGCEGSPTVALTVGIPPGVSMVDPQAQDGWQTATIRANGRTIAVTWKGGEAASDKPATFTVTMMLPAQEGVLAFPTTQVCASGEEHWSEVGVSGGKRPAPLLRVAAVTGAPSSLALSDGWFRALPPAVPSGAYFTLRNTGTRSVTLTGASSPACGMLMLHKSENQGGMGMMMDVSSADVPAGGELRFAPGGYHLMCMDAKPMLKPGTQVPVTLTFKDAPPLTAQFDVRNAAGK